MNAIYRSSLVVLAILLMSATFTFAQDSRTQDSRSASFTADKYIISAKAGGVNMTEGNVDVRRSHGKIGVLLSGDQLSVGDRVSTGADGRVEILLNPGSYLRLGADAIFEFKTTSLDDLQLRVDSGSAMFEVFATNKFRVSIVTPNGKVVLIDSGVYRVDVNTDGTAMIAVTEGKAEVGISNPTIVKKGRTAVIGTESPTVAKFDRDKRDELAQWSKSRAKDLAKMTSSLKNRSVRDSLMSSLSRGRWGLFDSFGLWVYNPFARGFCFLPFGYGWNSPYGYGYGSGIYWFNITYVVPPYVASGPSSVPLQTAKPRRRVDTDVVPPYLQVQKVRAPDQYGSGIDFPQETSRSRGMTTSPPPMTVSPAAQPAAPAAKPRDN